MAKTLSKTGINNSSTIQAWHVSQSVDALTGASDYDITISGSLVITASANQFTPVLIARGQINTFNISSSGNISSSTIFVSNGITSSAFRALNNATIGGTLGVTGATTLSSILGVAGATNLSSTLDVAGATTLSTLGVTGATTLTTLNVNNDIRLAGTLQATGSQGNFNQLFVSNSSGNPYPRLGWNNGAEWDFLTNVGGLQHGAAWYLSYPQLTEANLTSFQTSSDGNTWGDGVINENIKSMFYGENIKNNGIALSPIQGNSTQWARFEFDTGYASFDQFWLRGSTQTSSLYIKVEKRNAQNEYTVLWETTRSAGWPGHIIKIKNFYSDNSTAGRIRFTFRNISGSGNNNDWKVIYINCFNYLGSYSGTNGPSFFRIYDYNSTQANIRRPLLVTPPTSTNNLVTSLFTVGQSDNSFKAGFANGAGSTINSEHAKVGMWYTSTVNSTANPVTHIGFLRGNDTNSSGMTFNVNNIEMMRISNTGAITASGAISSSAGLFSTTLTTTGAITSSGAISSSAGLFGTTLRTSGAITSSGAISSSAGLFSTTLTTTGAITASIISASSGITASSILANNYRRATANLTTLGNVIIDASLTGSVTWIANFGGGAYNLTASMPQDGLSLDIYIQNNNTTYPSFNLCSTINNVNYSPVSGALNLGIINGTLQSIQRAFVQFRRVGNVVIVGAIANA